MPMSRPIALLAAALTLTMPLAPAHAQDAGSSRSTQGVAAAQIPMPTLLDVDFDGGSLDEFLVAVRMAADPEPVNVVLLEGAADLPIPSVTLRRVTAEAAFRAVCSRMFANVTILPSSGEPIITIEADPGAMSEMARRNEMLARRGSFGGSPAAMNDPIMRPEPATLRVYSVRDFVDGKSITYSTVLDALKTALAADEGQGAAEVLHHEASGVLIVRGTIGQQNVAEQVLDAIRTDARVGEKSQTVIEDQRRVLRQRAMDAEIQVRRSTVELDAAMEKFAHVGKLAEGGFVPEDELMSAKRSVELAKLQREQAEVQVQALREQLDSLGGRSDDGSAKTPMRAHSSGFSCTSPEVAMHMFESLNKMFQASGARGYIEISRGQARSDGPAMLNVSFMGTDEANEHFKAFTDDLRRLGMFDGKAHD